MTRASLGSSDAEQRRDIGEFLFERRSLSSRPGAIIVCQAQQDGRHVSGIVHQHREIGERDDVELRRRVDAHPALVGRVEMIDRRVCLEQRFAPPPFVLDERADRLRGRADVEDFRAVCHVRHDGFDAVLGQLLDKRGLGLRQAFGKDDVGAEPRKIPDGGAAVEIDRRDVRAVETANQLVLHDRARAHADFVHDELGGRDADDEAVAALERGVNLVANGNGIRAQWAGRRVGMELPDRACEQMQELFDRREIVRAQGAADPGTDSLGRSHVRFVIDGPQAQPASRSFQLRSNKQARDAPR